MIININEYKQIVKEKREMLESQCDSATSPQEYKQYVVNYRMYHARLLELTEKSIRNTKFICTMATVGLWVSLTGCAYCDVLRYDVAYSLWILPFAILLYIRWVADKELADFICIYKKEV